MRPLWYYQLTDTDYLKEIIFWRESTDAGDVVPDYQQRQLLFEVEGFRPVGDNRDNLYIWSVARCAQDKPPVESSGSDIWDIAFVYAYENGELSCRSIVIDPGSGLCEGSASAPISWFEPKMDIIAGKTREHSCDRSLPEGVFEADPET